MNDNYEVVEVMDSEDEELQQALQESLENHENSRSLKHSQQNLKDLLRSFQGNLNNTGKQEIIISRRHVLQSAFSALKRKFDSSCKLYVKFSGEMGLDHGGPRREFFRLVMYELSKSSLFEGAEGNKFFSHDLKKLQDCEYYFAGRLTGMSILHDGPGLYCLQEHLSRIMLELDTDLSSFDLELIVDTEWKEKLLQLQDVDSDQKRDQFLSANGDWLISQGYANAWRLGKDDSALAVQILVKQFIYYRISAEISQFKEGMDEVFGLWKIFKEHAQVCLEMLSRKSVSLTKDDIMEMLHIEWSAVGSNNRMLEEETVYSWEIFLQDIHDKTVEVTFEELLIFVTGADAVPPCGFPSKIVIEFYCSEEGVRRLPSASTCALMLYLPRGISNPDDFKEIMLTALRGSCGFEKI